MGCQYIRQHFPSLMVNGVPQPPLLFLRLHKAPPERPFLLPPRARPSRLAHRVVGVEARLCSLVRGVATFFQRVNHRGGANSQHSCCVPNATAIERHIADLLLHCLQSSPIAKMQDKRSSFTGWVPTTIALFSTSSATMFDDICAVTIRATNRFDYHLYLSYRIA